MYLAETTKVIETKLQNELHPTHLEVIDETHLHHGHRHPDQGGNYRILVVSSHFQGLRSLDRSRMIFKILNEEKTSGRIHSIGMKLLAPNED